MHTHAPRSDYRVPQCHKHLAHAHTHTPIHTIAIILGIQVVWYIKDWYFGGYWEDTGMPTLELHTTTPPGNGLATGYAQACFIKFFKSFWSSDPSNPAARGITTVHFFYISYLPVRVLGFELLEPSYSRHDSERDCTGPVLQIAAILLQGIRMSWVDPR